MVLCDETVPVIRGRVLNTNPVPSDPANHGKVCYVFEAFTNELIGKQSDYISTD